MTLPTLRDAALAYAERGWPVFPLHSLRSGVCSCGAACGSPGKHPRIARGFNAATTDPAQAHAWWGRWPVANVGIATGACSGLVVADLDGPDGERAFTERCGGQLPDTGRVRTGRGLHLYFAHPGDGVTVPSRAGVLPGVDVRGDGGYVVAPPSVHANGTRYTVETDLATLPPCPAWLYENGQGREAVSPPAMPDGGMICNGARNATLTSLAGTMRRRAMSVGAIEAALRVENAERCNPPLPEAEVGRIAASVARYAPTEPPMPGTSASAFVFRPLSAAQLLAQEPEPIPWLWEPILAAGDLAILSAPPKAGKSTLAYALAVSVAQGRRFLDYPTESGGVLILALEEGKRNVRRRLERFGLTPADPVHVWPERLRPEHLPKVRAFVASKKVKLVLLDTLSRYWVGTVKDENNNAEVAAATEPLLALARESGACVLMIHHDRKSGGEVGTSIRGAGDLFAVVDQALQLTERDRAPSQRVLRVIGRYQDESPSQVILTLDGARYTRISSDEDSPVRSGAESVVWAALLSDVGKTEDELAAETGRGRKAVSNALGSLGPRVAVSGSGHKGDPRRYRRADDGAPGRSGDSVPCAT